MVQQVLAVNWERSSGVSIRSIQATKVQSYQESSGHVILIDVREVHEFKKVSAPFAKNFPLSSLDVDQVLKSLAIDKGDSKTPLYFICRSGARSLKAAEMFFRAGYENIYNVEGGMLGWVELGLPTKK